MARWRSLVAVQNVGFGASKHFPLRTPGEDVRIPLDHTLLLGRGTVNAMVLKNIVCPVTEHSRTNEIFLLFVLIGWISGVTDGP